MDHAVTPKPSAEAHGASWTIERLNGAPQVPEVVAEWNEIYAHALNALEDGDRARASELLALMPPPDVLDDLDDLSGLARVFTEAGLPNGLDYIERAVGLAPDSPHLHLRYADLLMAHGRWREAFAEYEYRLRAKAAPTLIPPMPPNCPMWRGDPLPAQATLMIVGEQGFGETIQYARYFAEVRRRAAGRIVFYRQPEFVTPTARLLKGNFPFMEIVKIDRPPGSPNPKKPAIRAKDAQGQDQVWSFDCYVYLCSLPFVLTGAAEESLHFPIQGYLNGPPADTLPEPVRQATAGLKANRLKAAVAWRGSGSSRRDELYACPFTYFRALFEVEDVDFLSLQRVGSDELDESLYPNVLNLGPHLRDFADAAAIIRHVDVMITTDSALAHLAGALGKPTILLLQACGADGRWFHRTGRDRDCTPWYPTLRLLPQASQGDWPGLIARLRALMEARAWRAYFGKS